VVENLPHHPRVEGSSPPTPDGTAKHFLSIAIVYLPSNRSGRAQASSSLG